MSTTTMKSTATIGSNLRCEFAYTAPDRIDCQWYPDMPAHLSKKQMQRYLRACDAFIARIAAKRDGDVVVISI